jgi:hypothetical protein
MHTPPCHVLHIHTYIQAAQTAAFEKLAARLYQLEAEVQKSKQEADTTKEELRLTKELLNGHQTESQAGPSPSNISAAPGASTSVNRKRGVSFSPMYSDFFHLFLLFYIKKYIYIYINIYQVLYSG